MSTLRRWLEWPGRMAWRWFTGKPMDGVPRTDATWLTEGTMALDPATAPRLPRTLGEEIRNDIAQTARSSSCAVSRAVLTPGTRRTLGATAKANNG